MDDHDDPGFGVYIHWPFCAAKCPYCDFNSHVRNAVDHDKWCDALLTDLQTQADQTNTETVRSVFFGGGTPSLMDPKTVEALLDRIVAMYPCADDLEVTLEANPTSVEAEKFRAFKNAGITRISMGIQALNNADLKRLGRMHSAREAMDAFSIARSTFERVSFDLIYARQDQTLANWEAELTTALDMAVDHLSLYQLTIEPGTRFGDLYKRDRLKGLPDDALSADMFALTQDICEAAGMPAYEVSNHARAERECRHNLVYWRYGHYLGIGPGAHGRVGRDTSTFERQSHLMPETWLNGVTQSGHGLSGDRVLSNKERSEEYLLMSLRLKEGSNLSRFASISGCDLDSEVIGQLCDDGFLQRSNDRIWTTQNGRMVLNEILRQLLA